MNKLNLGTMADSLKTDGFAVVDRLCERALVRHLLAVSSERAVAVREALGDRQIGIGSRAGYVEIVQRSPGRWDVPISPGEFGLDSKTLPWWPLIAASLGEDAEHSFSGVVFSEQGSPAQYWHTDSPHESSRHLEPHAINVLVALHDVPIEMGPTECARGSHVLTNHLANTSLVLDELIYQHEETCPERLVGGTSAGVPKGCAGELVAGSCLIFDDRLLHRGLANHSSEMRHIAYFSYRRSGYDLNTHFESRRSIFESARTAPDN